MFLEIDFNKPYIQKEYILNLDEASIMNFYKKSNEVDRINLFFILISTYKKYTDIDSVRKSHLCYLISMYTHLYITPPGEDIISERFAEEACSLNNDIKYLDWLNYLYESKISY